MSTTTTTTTIKRKGWSRGKVNGIDVQHSFFFRVTDFFRILHAFFFALCLFHKRGVFFSATYPHNYLFAFLLLLFVSTNMDPRSTTTPRRNRNGQPRRSFQRLGRSPRIATPTLMQGLLIALAFSILIVLVVLGAVIARNTSRTRAAVKRVSETEVIENSALVAGEVSGYEVLQQYGFNDGIFAVFQTIWFGGGAYTFLATAQRLDVVSTNPGDTAPSGANARTVRIDGIGADGLRLVEDVDMNGTTAVRTVNSFLRINFFRVVDAGAQGANGGVISATSVDTNTTQAVMESVTSVGQLGIYSTPSNRRAFITAFTVSTVSTSGAGNQAVDLFLHQPDGIRLRIGHWALKGEGSTTFEQPLDLPILVPPDHSVEFQGSSSLAGTEFAVLITLLLEDV